MDIKSRKHFGKKSMFNDMRYLTQGVYPPANCSICGINRINEDGEPKWQSDFVIKHYSGKMNQVITICPKCRNKTINEIFEILISRSVTSALKKPTFAKGKRSLIGIKRNSTPFFQAGSN